MTGKVKFFDETRGFGFIAGDNGQDIFVHKTGTTERIRKDDVVEYYIQEGKKGTKAVQVKLIR